MSLAQVVDRQRLNRVCRGKSKDRAIEIELGLEAPNDVFRFAKAVLFTGKCHISNREPFPDRGGCHHLGLVRWNDLVFEPLEQDQRRRQSIGEMNR